MLISDTGVVIEPSTTAIAEAQQILIDTYGSTVNLDPTSPNGLLVQNIAIAITRREADQANTINSMNPNIATGEQLDAICANLNIFRIPATQSTATCVFTGLVGVSIPANSQVASTNGDIFLVEATVVIGVGGTVSGSVKAQTTGPIPTTVNTINKIITGISGWDTVNNPLVGTEGRELSTGSVESVTAGAVALNPISYFVTENTTDFIVIRDGLAILPHSILLALEGGSSDLDVATMLFQRLSAGCGMSGTHSFSIPIPGGPETFDATWLIATPKALGINIQLKLGVVYPPSITTVIAQIINDNFDFNVIGRFIDATQFIFILMSKGILPIIGLTFNVGATTNLIQYTMPVTDSLGSSMLSSNVTVSYV
jgi:Baseplate J-like protein